VRRVELRIFNGSWEKRGVLNRLRRKFERAAAQGECLILDGEDVSGLSPQALHALVLGLPESKVKVIGFPALRPYALPTRVEPAEGDRFDPLGP
jgi:hypothetical protein